MALLLGTIFLIQACQKEYSVEKGGYSGTAQGELVDSLGNCKAPQIYGTYSVDTPLVTTKNYVIVNVNITSPGKYKIYTDTVNGMWFMDSGFIVSSGATTVKLKGYGTPILPKTTDFALLFNNTICSFSISVNGSATGGGSGGGGGTGTNSDYFPDTQGSSWTYQYVPKLGNIDTFTSKVVAGQVTVDTLTYSRFATSIGDTFYFAKDGKGTYYALSTVDFDYTFVFDSIPNGFISYPFLKDFANVGDNWTTGNYIGVKYNGQVGSAKAVFTIITKNTVPYTIGGKTYSNVINVQREIFFTPTLTPNSSSTYTSVLKGNSYYAKAFGLIDQVFVVTPSQSCSLYQTPVIK